MQFANTRDELAVLSTKHLGKDLHRAQIKLVNGSKVLFMVNVGLRRPIFSYGFSLHRVLSRYDRDKPDL